MLKPVVSLTMFRSVLPGKIVSRVFVDVSVASVVAVVAVDVVVDVSYEDISSL